MSSCHGRRAVGSVIVDGSRKIGFSSQNSLSEASLVQESGIRNQESGIRNNNMECFQAWKPLHPLHLFHLLHLLHPFPIHSIQFIHRTTQSSPSTEPLISPQLAHVENVQQREPSHVRRSALSRRSRASPLLGYTPGHRGHKLRCGLFASLGCLTNHDSNCGGIDGGVGRM